MSTMLLLLKYGVQATRPEAGISLTLETEQCRGERETKHCSAVQCSFELNH